MKKGYVYVLSNPGMPGLCKIGRSINGGRDRANEIDGTGVPFPFEVEFECLFEDCVFAEARVHQDLSRFRINPRREFFNVEPVEAKEAVLRVCAHEIDCDVSHVDMTVCAAHMSSVAHKLGAAPPDPYRIVEKISDGAWLEAFFAHKASLQKASRPENPSLQLVDDADACGESFVACDTCHAIVDAWAPVANGNACQTCFERFFSLPESVART